MNEMRQLIESIDQANNIQQEVEQTDETTKIRNTREAIRIVQDKLTDVHMYINKYAQPYIEEQEDKVALDAVLGAWSDIVQINIKLTNALKQLK